MTAMEPAAQAAKGLARITSLLREVGKRDAAREVERERRQKERDATVVLSEDKGP